MSATTPVYAFLSAAMLTLCAGFLTWWLVVVAVRVARQLPWLRALLLQRLGLGSRAAGLAPGRGGDVRVLFTAQPSAALARSPPTGTTGRTSRSSATPSRLPRAAVPPSESEDLTHDRPSGAAQVHHSHGGGAVTALHAPSRSVSKSESSGVNDDDGFVEGGGGTASGTTDSDVGFATVNPLRASRSSGDAGNVATVSGLPPHTGSATSSVSRLPAVAVPYDPSGSVSASDRGRRVLRAGAAGRQ